MAQVPVELWMVKSPQAKKVREEVELEYDLPGRPGSSWPRLPNRLTTLTDEELMDLLVEFNRWCDHIGGALFLQEIDERYSENEESTISGSRFDSVVGELGGGKSDTSVTRARARRDSDPAVVLARASLLDTYNKRKALQYLNEVLTRNAAVLSRELTRRVGRADRDARTERFRT